MKIYTKTGDDGTTGLFDGQRVKKYSVRVECYGTIDELNSVLGIISSFNPPEPIASDINSLIKKLFVLCTDLATPHSEKLKIERINSADIVLLENLIDKYTSELPELKNFILPGGSSIAAYLNNARTVCRRAERLITTLSENEDLGDYISVFVNRLSDYLFTASRYANNKLGFSDVIINSMEQ